MSTLLSMVLAKMWCMNSVVVASTRDAVGEDGVYIRRWNVLYHQLVRSGHLHRSIPKWALLVACCTAAEDLRPGVEAKK